MDYKPQTITKALITKLVKAVPPDKPKEIRDRKNGMILRHQPSGYLALYAELGRGKRERICNARRIADESDSATIAMARNEARRLRGESAGGRDFQTEREEQSRIPTLADYLENDYRAYAENNKLRTGEGNIERVKHRFPKFLPLKLNEIGPDRVERWKATRRGVTPETINRDVSTLRAVLGKAVKPLKLLPENPLSGIDMMRVDRNARKVRALTADEKARLIQVLKERDDEKRAARARANEWRAERDYELMPTIGTFSDLLTPAVILALETGMRFGEQFSLTWESVDLKGRTIAIEGERAKSYQTREIPLSESAYRTLRDWWLQQGQPKSGLVFHINGKPVGSLKKGYHAALKQAGIERVNKRGQRINWHSLRHTFGTLLGAAGVDPVTLKELMGHANLSTTQRYLHSDDERKRAAIGALEAIND